MFGKRLISSIVLVVIALTTILMSGAILVATLFAISIIAFYELSNACNVHENGKKINELEWIGYISIALYYMMMLLSGEHVYLSMVVILTFMGVMFAYVVYFPKYTITQVMTTFFIVIYGAVMFSFIYMTRELELGIYLVWLIFISSWISDTCAYLVGMSIGKHKLAPVLSPKKSIEGSIGGVVGAGIVGGLFGFFLASRVDIHVVEVVLVFALIGAVGSVVSQMGDLAASAIKRQHNLKDYGNIIPGHGGIMDRFDSVVVTAPMIYFMAILILG